MLVRLPDLGTEDTFDYCIIGTGPAGISCALALVPSGKRILLIEGGGSDLSEESQSLYRGTTVGDPYFDLDAARLRYFGGSSNHWTGICRPLEAVDFEEKAALHRTAWPIEKSVLDSYLGRASSMLEIPSIPSDRSIGSSGLRQVHFARSPRVRFGEKYRDELSTRANLFLCLKANLIAFATNGVSVTGARIVDFERNEVVVRAGRYVLAAGGIENSRLLLWSNALSNGALVRNAASLGRYWMEHLYVGVGGAIVLGDAAFALEGRKPIFLGFSREITEREGILGGAIKCQARNEEGLRQTLADLACVAPDWARRAMDFAGLGMACAIEVRSQSEQVPVAENRIELAEEKDALGVPRVRLHWRRNEIDVRTIRTMARLFGAYLAEADIGRLRLDEWVIQDGGPENVPRMRGGRHHMGGTRMSDTPDYGIVDRDCKVFGQDNLYVAGSSVFPSGGFCNPTLSIVQLALRLGDHLRAKR